MVPVQFLIFGLLGLCSCSFPYSDDDDFERVTMVTVVNVDKINEFTYQ